MWAGDGGDLTRFEFESILVQVGNALNFYIYLGGVHIVVLIADTRYWTHLKAASLLQASFYSGSKVGRRHRGSYRGHMSRDMQNTFLQASPRKGVSVAHH